MARSSDWHMGQYLEWYTELPSEDRSERSPIFMIRNTECYFLFRKQQIYKGSAYYYDLYLKPKASRIKLRAFPIIVYSDHDGYGAGAGADGTFSRTCSSIFSDWNLSILSFPENCYTRMGHIFNSGRPSIRFYFMFPGHGLLLPLEKKRAEKSTQSGLVLSLKTDLEYLSLDFGELMKNGEHSDVQLLCNGGNIPAHRAVLAARSETFSKMFRYNTEERKTGLINLTMTEKSVMELCLEFIYKGKVLNLPVEKASNLYVLGHVLSVSSLTKMCADLIIRNLSGDNYISYLVLADEYKDDFFKNGIIDYVYENTELLKSESWVKFSNENAKIAVDVYRRCMFK